MDNVRQRTVRVDQSMIIIATLIVSWTWAVVGAASSGLPRISCRGRQIANGGAGSSQRPTHLHAHVS